MRKYYFIACLALLLAVQACSATGETPKKGEQGSSSVKKDSTIKVIGASPHGNIVSGDTIPEGGLSKVKEAFLAVYGDNFESLIKDPLEIAYDSTQIEYHKRLIELFDYKKDKGMDKLYRIYYPMLENYGRYNDETIQLIKSVVKKFELLDPNVPDIEFEKDLFFKSVDNSAYYSEYRYKESAKQTIKHLEDVIKDTKSLFEDPSKFTKENFEKQLERLGKK